MIHSFHGHSNKRRGRREGISNDGAASAIANVHHNESENYNGDASENRFDFLETDYILRSTTEYRISHAAVFDFSILITFSWPIVPADSNDHQQLVNNRKNKLYVEKLIIEWLQILRIHAAPSESRDCGVGVSISSLRP